MLGKRGMRKFLNKRIEKTATKMAGVIEKDDFLKQLRDSWYPFVKKNSDITTEVKKARERISKSEPFKKAFEVVGITDEDLENIIKDIQAKKPEQIEEETPKVGRNDPCPCGSGKKYKKCCLRKTVTKSSTDNTSTWETEKEAKDE